MKSSLIATILSSRIRGVIAEAKALQDIPHSGLRGRFRELVLTRLVGPMLPPSCLAIHGTAVDVEGDRFAKDGEKLRTEDDVLVVDRDRVPSLLFSEGEGIVPVEAVLAKIEVKSVLTRGELRDAIDGAISFRKIPLALPDEDLVEGAALRCIFAFDSDSTKKGEYQRLLELIRESGWNEATPPISSMCIVGKGCWVFASLAHGGSSGWHFSPADENHSEVCTFLGTLMNSLPMLREKRRGARLGSHLIDVEKDLRPV